jgi:hypothetical protein
MQSLSTRGGSAIEAARAQLRRDCCPAERSPGRPQRVQQDRVQLDKEPSVTLLLTYREINSSDREGPRRYPQRTIVIERDFFPTPQIAAQMWSHGLARSTSHRIREDRNATDRSFPSSNRSTRLSSRSPHSDRSPSNLYGLGRTMTICEHKHDRRPRTSGFSDKRWTSFLALETRIFFLGRTWLS